MNIPDKIKIGGHWFEIHHNKESEGFTNSGHKNSWYNRIILQNELVQSKKESVLFHEIIHEIDWQNQLNLSENQVSSLSEAIYQVLIDNGMLEC